MRIIKIENLNVLLDDEDYHRLVEFTWHLVWRKSGTPHVARKLNATTTYMHHYIIGYPPKGMVTDHADGSGLNNQRYNLSFVTRRDNALNSDRSREARIVEPHGRKFRVRPYIDGIRVNIGSYETEAEAMEIAQKYKNAR